MDIGRKSCYRIYGRQQLSGKSGRVDYTNDRCTPSNGLLPFADKDANHIRKTFTRLGFNDQQTVALIGAHGVGRCHKRFSGWEGKWTRTPKTFSNQFYVVLLNETWSQGEVPETGKTQYFNADKSLIMLNTDMELIRDKSYLHWVEIYAKDEPKFFTTFPPLSQSY